MSNQMPGSMKMGFSSIFIALVLLPIINTAYAMSCSYEAGITVSVECPMPFQDENKVFCCYNSGNIAHCCDVNEFISTNVGIIAGIAVGCLVLVALLVLCCCCCCSCCLLAQRRQQRGTVLYPPRI